MVIEIDIISTPIPSSTTLTDKGAIDKAQPEITTTPYLAIPENVNEKTGSVSAVVGTGVPEQAVLKRNLSPAMTAVLANVECTIILYFVFIESAMPPVVFVLHVVFIISVVPDPVCPRLTHENVI